MSIKKSQAILKCFIDLKSSVWFTLGSEDETMYCDCDTYDFFSSSAGQGVENAKWPAVLISGAPHEKIVQNHLNIALLNVF